MSHKLTNRSAVYRFGLTLVVSVSLFIWGACENLTRESNALIVLFALPLLIEVMALLYLRLKPLKEDHSAEFFNLFWSTILFCAVLNYTFWIIYVIVAHGELVGALKSARLQLLSYLAAGGITLLLIFVIIVTLAFMTPKDGGDRLGRYLERIKTGAERRPFWTLLHSMTVFLTVAYLFGFAFAFHDLTVPLAKRQSTQPKAAWSPPDRGDEQDAAVNGSAQGAPASAQQPTARQLPPLYMANLPNFDRELPPPDAREAGELPCVDFYFAEPSADLDRFDDDDNVDVQKIEDEGVKFADRELVHRKKTNQDAMLRAVDRILRLGAGGQEVHVQLLGHASKNPVRGGPFQNNYVLSEARMLRVLFDLKSEVASKNGGQWINAEWDTIPLSSAEFPRARSYMDKVCRGMIDDDKVVNVSITAVRGHPYVSQLERYRWDDFKRLSLLDNIYFAMYSVTTTGYGDIIPTTDYAKFLTCLANICEVFFIVGLFNSLMALRGDGK